jgi:hypothetical protein
MNEFKSHNPPIPPPSLSDSLLSSSFILSEDDELKSSSTSSVFRSSLSFNDVSPDPVFVDSSFDSPVDGLFPLSPNRSAHPTPNKPKDIISSASSPFVHTSSPNYSPSVKPSESSPIGFKLPPTAPPSVPLLNLDSDFSHKDMIYCFTKQELSTFKNIPKPNYSNIMNKTFFFEQEKGKKN